MRERGQRPPDRTRSGNDRRAGFHAAQMHFATLLEERSSGATSSYPRSARSATKPAVWELQPDPAPWRVCPSFPPCRRSPLSSACFPVAPRRRYDAGQSPRLARAGMDTLMTRQDSSYAEEQLRALIATAVDGIMCIDALGRAELFNPACERIFGYAASEVLGRNISMLMPSKYADHHDGYIGAYISTGKRKIIGIGREVEGMRKNGEVFPMDLSVGEFTHRGARRFVGIVRDLSARAASERRLHELQHQVAHMGRVSAVAEMGSALAHELNQPLTAMTLYLTAAERAIHQDPDKAADLFRRSKTEAARAGEIVRRIRQMVERTDHEMATFNLSETLAASIDLCRIADAERNSVINVEGLPLGFEAFGDSTQVQQVLVNLIKNALDATEGQLERLVLITAEIGEALDLYVEDNGPGIAPEIRGRLFSPFTSSKARGLGIGLSICRNIMEGHGGALDLVSERGRRLGGACFRLRLPLESVAP